MTPGKLKISESVQVQSLGIRGVFENCVGNICGTVKYLLGDPKDNKVIGKPIEYLPPVKLKNYKKPRVKKRLIGEELSKGNRFVSNVFIKPGDIVGELKDISFEYIRFISQNLNKEVGEKIKTCLTIDNTDISLEGIITKKFSYKGEANYLVKFTKFDVKNQENQTKMLEKLRKFIINN